MAFDKKETMIDVENLYIIILSTITNVERDGKTTKWSWEGATYIAARSTLKTSESYEFRELFTNNLYRMMRDANDVRSGKLAVSGHESITKFMNKLDTKISTKELTNILKRLNAEPTLELDYFLQSILIIQSKIIASSLSSDKKDKYIQKLLILSDEYISAMISLKEGKYTASNNEINELKIRERFFKKLIEIENELNLYFTSIEKLFDAREEMKRILGKNE